MKFATDCRWWTRESKRTGHTLEGRCLPLLTVGGVLVALFLSAWRYKAAEKFAATPAAMPSGRADFHQLPAVHIRLAADAAGRLSTIVLNGRPVRDAAQLRADIKAFFGTTDDATVEAELDCDGNLRYEDTQRTIAAISSYPAGDGRASVPLVDRVKFLPRRIKD